MGNISFRGFQALLASVASVATIAALYFLIASNVGWPPFRDNPEVEIDLPSQLPEIPVLGDDRPVLPDFLASDVSSCSLSPGPESELSLSFKIINTGNLEFEEAVFFKAESDLGLKGQDSTFFGGEDSWHYDFAEEEWVSDVVIDLELTLDDFGKEHTIVISINPTDLVKEDDPSNNDTSVLVPLPTLPPSEDYEDLLCTP